MSLTITDPSFDKVYTMYAWRDNNIRFVLTQGEGATGTDGTISHVKVAKFQLRDDRGIIDLTSCEVLLALTRPDGSEDLLACSSASGEAAQGIISCPITASATAIAGQAIGEIRVLSASSGNPTGIIKFFGVHFQIYEGVSDDAAEQSTQFSALTAELQKVALLTPEGTAEMDDTLEHGGTNPVASGVIFDNTMKYKYIQASEINNSTRADYVYHGIDEVGYYFVMICVRNPNGSRKTQYKFYTSSPTSFNNGKIVFRTYDDTTSTWGDWTPVVKDGIIENFDSIAPEKEYDAHSSRVETYMAYTPKQPADSGTYIDITLNERSEIPNSVSVTIPAGGSKITICDTITFNKWSESVTGNSYDIKNLIPERLYTYLITDNSGKILSSGSCMAHDQVRFIDAGTIVPYFIPRVDLSQDNTTTRQYFNIRDLGGWTCDGGKLKYGMIYRGCELSGVYKAGSTTYGFQPKEYQKSLFRDFLGIRDEIDLRQGSNELYTNTETTGDDTYYDTVDDINESAIGAGVEYERFSVLEYGKSGSSYEPLAEYALPIKRIAKDLSEGKPVYVHCSAGADRTGTLCMLVEAICGVSRADLDRDYELTSFSKQFYGNLNNIRTRNGYRGSTQSHLWDNLIAYIENNFGDSNTSFRDKVIEFAIKAGVTIEEINMIRGGLIDGIIDNIKHPYTKATISKTLSHAVIDNDTEKIERYQPFKARVLPNDGYVLTSVVVTMGGTDITSSVYLSGIIDIPHVSGDISITASASDVDIYSKPSGGIPKTDLASSVQTSLEKADDAETKLANIYETTQNHFNVATDIIIGKNNLGSDVNTRAITVPIYTGNNSTVVSVRKMPVNLKYKVYAYPEETFSSPTDYTTSGWISTIGQDLVIDNVNKRYIRVMFGSVNDAALTASDFIGLQMQVEAGSQKTEFVSPFTAVDCVARNRSYPVHLKICSYNVGMYSYGISTDTPAANAVSNLVDFLEKNNFDIIGIQEGRRYIDGNNIDEKTYNDFFISQENILNNCAIKSQFVLKETGEGTFTAGSRKYVYAIANIGNKEVFIISVHFALNASDRSSNYTELLALLSQHEYFIVFGDFNAAIEYSSDVDEQTQAEFNNLINAGYTVANGGRWGLLNTMGTTSKHPDNICVSKNIKMISAKVADVYSTMNSDHLPIIVDIVV